MPLPELQREEFNAYRQTLLQFHLYEFIFHEADTELGSISKEDLFVDQLRYLDDLAPVLIQECQHSDYHEAFFDLRWYSTKSIGSIFCPKKDRQDFPSAAETMCSTTYKADPSLYDMQLLKQASEFKSQYKPTLVRLVYAILETLKYYCKVTKRYIMKDRSPEEAVQEYCKRVLFHL